MYKPPDKTFTLQKCPRYYFPVNKTKCRCFVVIDLQVETFNKHTEEWLIHGGRKIKLSLKADFQNIPTRRCRKL